MPSPAEYAQKHFKVYAFVRPTTDDKGRKLSRQESAEAALEGINTFAEAPPSAQRYVIAQLLYLNLQQLGANTEITRELAEQVSQAFTEPEPEPVPDPEPEAEAEGERRPRHRITAAHLSVVDPDQAEEPEDPNAG